MNPVEAGTAMGIMTMAVGAPSNSIPMIFDPVASLALSQDLCALLVRVEGRSGEFIIERALKLFAAQSVAFSRYIHTGRDPGKASPEIFFRLPEEILVGHDTSKQDPALEELEGELV
jgi:hypothetical protein